MAYDRACPSEKAPARLTWGAATPLAITADTFLVHYLHELELTPVPHEMVTPGVVNTRQVRERPWPLRLIVSLFG